MKIRRYCPRCGARPVGRCACRTRGIKPAEDAAQAPATGTEQPVHEQPVVGHHQDSDAGALAEVP